MASHIGHRIIEQAGAHVYTSGPQVLTYVSAVDDSEQPYGLYVPPAFNPSKPYPLVLSLHGAGSHHRLNLRQVFGKGQQPGESMARASRSFPPLPAVNYLVASAFARGTMGYQNLAETEVDAELSDVQRRFRIDADRVYLTGLSMGGRRPGGGAATATSAAGYGLVFIAPRGDQYVLVDSGLPWWTGAERATRQPGLLDHLLRSPFHVLQRFGDYILFKGSLEQVIAAGRFDRDWNMPAAEAAKMSATQAVVIHEGGCTS